MNIKTNKILFIGIFTSLTGSVLKSYADRTTYVDETGLMHESFATPLGALAIIIGIILIIIGLFNYFKKRKNIKHENNDV
jgi:hypothetical protein